MLKRPLCLFCLSFILGILLTNSAGFAFFLLVTAVAFLCTAILFPRLKKTTILCLLTLLSFTAGGLVFHISERNYIYKLNNFYGKQINICGYIDSEIEKDGDKIKFTLKTNEIEEHNSKNKINSKLLIYVYNTSSNSMYNHLDYRTVLSLSTVINRPKPATNPGGFNYQRYLASTGISGTVNIMDYSDITIKGKEPGGLIKRLGYKIKNTVLGIVEHCLDKNQAGLLSGMIIGYKDGLDENAFQAFSIAGLTHIMVASGMNVAFIILPLKFIFDKVHIDRKTANISTILVLILFVFVTGFSASVVRAVIMGIIILSGQIIMRETDIYTSIVAAALLLLTSNPYVIFDIGFQLSFAATVSLVMFYPGIKAAVSFRYIPEIISDTLSATVAAQLGVVPISLYYFNSLSLISVFSNLLVVPTVQIITIIGFIMVFTGLLNINLAVLIGYINNSFLSFVLFVTETSAKIPYASIKLPTPSILLIVIYYVFILYLFKGRKSFKRVIGYNRLVFVVPILFILIFCIYKMVPDPLEITFLDVGQGDSTFIRTAHGTRILIDGGGREAGSKSSFDIGESVMVPYILDQGTKSLDILIASHGHSDHTEGLEALLKEIKVGTVILPDTDGDGFEKIIDICKREGVRIEECNKGDLIRLDSETKLEVLNPLEFSKDTLSQQSLNNSSLVLKLIYKNIKVLFTGDVEVPVEERLLDSSVDIGSDLIKIGHHGSVTSSCEAFIDRVKPAYAVISVGERNRFGHPSQFVIDRLDERNIKLLRTDKYGAVTAKSYGYGFKFSTMRKGN